MLRHLLRHRTSSTSRKAETYSKIRGPLAHMPSKKDRNDSAVEKKKINSHARVIGKRYFATGNSMRAKQGRSGLPKESELRRGPKDFMESPVPIMQHEKYHWHNVLCLWRSSNISQKRKGGASSMIFTPRRLHVYPSSDAGRDTASKSRRESQ